MICPLTPHPSLLPPLSTDAVARPTPVGGRLYDCGMAGGVAGGGPGGAGTIAAGSCAPPAGGVVTVLAGAAAGPESAAAPGAAPRGWEVAAFRAWLASLDGGGLSDRERVELVAELERVKGALAAAQARATHALRESREAVDGRDVARSVGSQVA